MRGKLTRGIIMLTTRPAKIEDLDTITEIYNDAILNTVATFDTEPKTLEEQKVWFASHVPKYPVLVVEQDGLVVGWASLSKWSEKRAYSETTEGSLYVKKEYRGQGIGKRLLESIVQEGKKAGFHSVMARIAEGGETSVHLCESVGFEHVGVMKEAGRKFGKLLDVYLMQKIL